MPSDRFANIFRQFIGKAWKVLALKLPKAVFGKPNFGFVAPKDVFEQRHEVNTESVMLSLQKNVIGIHNNPIWKISTKITNKTQ